MFAACHLVKMTWRYFVHPQNSICSSVKLIEPFGEIFHHNPRSNALHPSPFPFLTFYPSPLPFLLVRFFIIFPGVPLFLPPPSLLNLLPFSPTFLGGRFFIIIPGVPLFLSPPFPSLPFTLPSYLSFW